MTQNQINRSGPENRASGDGWRGSLRRIGAWAIVVMVLLLIPLIGMQISDEWNWGFFDFVFAFIVLFGTGVTYELISRKADTLAYKAGVAVAVVAGLLLVWVNAAVGMIGDDEAVNLLYFTVLVVGLIGAFLSRFEPRGMARASIAMAVTQLLIPLVVLAIPNLRGALMEPPGPLGVAVLNLFFAILFVGSALFFQKANQQHHPVA